MSRRHHEPAAAEPDGWTLIGGPMVLLHALEHDAEPPRISTDLDILVNARVKDQVRLRAVTEIAAPGHAVWADLAAPAAARARLALRTLLPDASPAGDSAADDTGCRPSPTLARRWAASTSRSPPPGLGVREAGREPLLSRAATGPGP